jgi:hypothetical protein
MPPAVIGIGALLMAAGVAVGFAPPPPAFAASAYCLGGPGRQVAQKVPEALLAAVAKTFEIGPDEARAAAFVRCVGSRLMACWIGANLDCDKADTRRSLQGAADWCDQHPGADNVPMVATGHDTIYDWRCVGRRAVAGRILSPVDAQGYIADNWRELR